MTLREDMASFVVMVEPEPEKRTKALNITKINTEKGTPR